jgi:hypothetical protein
MQVRGCRLKVEGRKSEVGGQRAEVGSRRAEVGSRKSEVRGGAVTPAEIENIARQYQLEEQWTTFREQFLDED